MFPLISIITPVYNCEKYIEESILSVLNQTYQRWEHIIINDSSTDSTLRIIQKYAQSDKRIKIINLEQNVGVAHARNIGIGQAAGDYIAFLDGDDQWKNHKLEHHMKYILSNHLQFSYTAYEVVDESGQHIKNIIPSKLNVNYQQLLCTNVIACCTVIIKSDLIKKELFPEISHEDYAAWLNILYENDLNALGIPDILSTYRKVKTSISSNKWKTIKWNWHIYYKNQKLGIMKSLRCLISFIFLTGIKYLK